MSRNSLDRMMLKKLEEATKQLARIGDGMVVLCQLIAALHVQLAVLGVEEEEEEEDEEEDEGANKLETPAPDSGTETASA